MWRREEKLGEVHFDIYDVVRQLCSRGKSGEG